MIVDRAFDPVLRWLIYLVASGLVFFPGAAMLIAGAWLDRLGPSRSLRVARNSLLIAGLALVYLSSTPRPAPLRWAMPIVVVAWAISRIGRERRPPRLILGIDLAFAAVWLAAIGAEIPRQVRPTLPPLGRPTLGIIGDSLTEGMGTSDIITWPRLLAGAHDIPVRDHARMGATVSSALEQAEQVGPDEDLILLEIGGNDLLGTTTPDDFEAGLSRLLSVVHRPGRTLVMLELPLPPGAVRFGEIQRRLAREYDVILVPKRFLIGLLQTPGATLDTIHLSQHGHHQMAEGLWEILSAAYNRPSPRR